MSQDKIWLFLKANPKKWFTTKQISLKTEQSLQSVIQCCKRLRKRANFKQDTLSGDKIKYLYKYKQE